METQFEHKSEQWRLSLSTMRHVVGKGDALVVQREHLPCEETLFRQEKTEKCATET